MIFRITLSAAGEGCRHSEAASIASKEIFRDDMASDAKKLRTELHLSQKVSNVANFDAF
jgi:hypothetical protein